MLSTLQWLAVVGVLAGYCWLVWKLTDEARDRIVAWWTTRKMNRTIVRLSVPWPEEDEERARALRSINVHKAVSPFVDKHGTTWTRYPVAPPHVRRIK